MKLEERIARLIEIGEGVWPEASLRPMYLSVLHEKLPAAFSMLEELAMGLERTRVDRDDWIKRYQRSESQRIDALTNIERTVNSWEAKAKEWLAELEPHLDEDDHPWEPQNAARCVLMFANEIKKDV